eukprot:scaffold1200_cov383-Prasinococcus_capsulatus_cf.AAC.7
MARQAMWHTLAVALLALTGQMCTALRELPTPITEAGGPELARGFPVEVSAVVVCLSCLPTTSDVNQPFDQESRFSNSCLNSELAVWTEGLPLAEVQLTQIHAEPTRSLGADHREPDVVVV